MRPDGVVDLKRDLLVRLAVALVHLDHDRTFCRTGSLVSDTSAARPSRHSPGCIAERSPSRCSLSPDTLKSVQQTKWWLLRALVYYALFEALAPFAIMFGGGWPRIGEGV